MAKNYYNEFISGVDGGDLQSANIALMREIGNLLVKNREDFVHLLNESGIKVSIKDSDAHLVSSFIKNIGSNKQLTLGASLLINMNNKQIGFDGKNEISDDGVKAAYLVMRSSFSGDEFSNVGGVLSALGGIFKGGTDIANKLIPDKNAALNLATQKKQAQAAMTQQILAQRQSQLDAATKEKESKSKKTKILIIAGASLAGIGLIIGGIYLLKKHKANK